MAINEKTLEYLANLSRIELDKRSEGKILEDIRKILNYFEELKEVDTENIEPMAGGTVEKNVFREDIKSDKQQAASDKLVEQFPKKENGFLKIPPVFE